MATVTATTTAPPPIPITERKNKIRILGVSKVHAVSGGTTTSTMPVTVPIPTSSYLTTLFTTSDMKWVRQSVSHAWICTRMEYPKFQIDSANTNRNQLMEQSDPETELLTFVYKSIHDAWDNPDPSVQTLAWYQSVFFIIFMLSICPRFEQYAVSQSLAFLPRFEAFMIHLRDIGPVFLSRSNPGRPMTVMEFVNDMKRYWLWGCDPYGVCQKLYAK